MGTVSTGAIYLAVVTNQELITRDETSSQLPISCYIMWSVVTTTCDTYDCKLSTLSPKGYY